MPLPDFLDLGFYLYRQNWKAFGLTVGLPLSVAVMLVIFNDELELFLLYPLWISFIIINCVITLTYGLSAKITDKYFQRKPQPTYISWWLLVWCFAQSFALSRIDSYAFLTLLGFAFIIPIGNYPLDYKIIALIYLAINTSVLTYTNNISTIISSISAHERKSIISSIYKGFILFKRHHNRTTIMSALILILYLPLVMIWNYQGFIWPSNWDLPDWVLITAPFVALIMVLPIQSLLFSMLYLSNESYKA
jgi:hypothetical protein